jgi:hypothetical protein
MENKKNIVIKVRYPSADKMAGHEVSAPKVITEWNIKRIALALLGAALTTVVLFNLFKQDTKKTALQSKAVVPEQIVNTPEKSKTEIKKNIIRALLTFKIDNNEPEAEIALPLKLSKANSTSVYYFVELNAMKGRTVYHEWLLDNELITRKKVNISDDNWRTSSRQLFAYSDRTNWTARLVDETGQILNEIHFNAVYE